MINPFIKHKPYKSIDVYTAQPEKVSLIDIDASDFNVGPVANGAVITNRFTQAGVTLTVVGTGLSIAENAEGKKCFVFDGSTVIQASDPNGVISDLHESTGNFTAVFIGKVGNITNPDAAYGLFGDNGSSSASIGICAFCDNRSTVNPKNTRLMVTNGSSGNPVVSASGENITYNTRKSLAFVWNNPQALDCCRIYFDGELAGVFDRTRTSQNSTSSLGTSNAPTATASTYAFQIGSSGNGAIKLVGEIEKFVLLGGPLTSTESIRALSSGLGGPETKGAKSVISNPTLQTINNGAYIFGGCYAARSNKRVFVSSSGPDHFSVGSDREGVINTSVDKGYNWPAFSSIFQDATTSVHGGVSGGYTSSGRLVISYGKYNTSTGTYVGLITRYSDDDGVSWSAENSLTLPSTTPALTSYVAHDKLEILSNGDVIIPWYGINNGTEKLYNVYVMRSSDNGFTWTHNLIYSSTTDYRNEVSVVELETNKLLACFRNETVTGTSPNETYQYTFFYSIDNGLTWQNLGVMNPERIFVYAHPPMLRRFEISGIRVIAFYFYNRGTRRWKVMYAKASDLVTNGITAWTGKTLYHIDIPGWSQNAVGWRSGYPFVIHPDNELKFEGVIFEELTSTNTQVRYVRDNAKHLQRLKTELSIV